MVKMETGFKLREEKLEVYVGLLAMFVAFLFRSFEAMVFIGLLVVILSLYHIEQAVEKKK